MSYDVDEIFAMLEYILGSDADGIYLCDREIEEGDWEDCPIFSTSNFSWEVSRDIWYNDNCHIEVKNGVTRIVFIPSDKDYVIKMSITGTYDYKDMSDMYDEEGNYNEYYSLFPSEQLVMYRHITEECNLMEEENVLYEDAGAALQEFLLPNVYVGEWNGMSVYIQKKIFVSSLAVQTVKIDLPSNCTPFSKIVDELRDITSSFPSIDIPSEFLYDMLKLTGDELTFKACSELAHLGISDLHRNNVGYTKDKKCYIFDYAGYVEEDVWD